MDGQYNLVSTTDSPTLAIFPNVTDDSYYNVSVNGSLEDSHGGMEFNFYMTEQRTFLILLLLVILIGNSVVLVAVAMSGRKSRMNFFIRHLALSDLLVGLLSVLPDLVLRFTLEFYGGQVVCKITKYSMALVTYGSTFVLVALSIDRLDAIARPLRFSDGGRRCRILIGVSWGLAALYSIPSAIIFKGDHCYAYLTQSQWQIYLTLVATLVFFIPAIVIAICYGAMICIIWRHTQIPKCGEKVSCTTPMYPKDGYENDNSRQKRPFRFRGRDTSMSSRGVIPQAKIRTIKMTFVIILVFILCWSPFFIYNLLSVYGVIPLDQTTIAMSAFIQSLAPLNSAANPMIYGVFSTRICRQLRKIRFCRVIFDFIGCCIDESERRRIRIVDPTIDETSTRLTNTSRVKFKPTNSISQEKEIMNLTDLEKTEMCDLVLSSVKPKT